MIEYFDRKDTAVDDKKLRDILKQCDPVPPVTEASLAALENNIFAKIDNLTERGGSPTFGNDWIFAGIFQQGWNMRAVAFAAILIVASGFIVGQILYGTEIVAAQSDTLSLVAFADEASGQYLPATDTSWGDSDDNAQ